MTGKLIKTEGCSAWGFDYINGNETNIINNFDENTIKKLSESVFKLINTKDKMIEFLMWATVELGEFEYDNEPCECCGDYVTTYTLEF